ncbi:HlyC/CorC family transporter [Ilyomonas limi]|uniref:HlyC/CorC family transporter n=1 Tax=Ilyomonas limi TaxID=2575867 RepID=A0A4U3L6S5_9BACT|nr:hemolysin family protein [Ilyomonas limi]TKK70951.1 HlyC/CorC family transporter [Ilyomonas limi]
MTLTSLLITASAALLLIMLFAGVETAFINANRLGIELKKKQGRRSGIILSNFIEEPGKFISASVAATVIFITIFSLLVAWILQISLWTVPFFASIENEYLRLFIDALVAISIVLFFVEYIAKAIFKAKSDTLLSFFAPVAQFFYRIFYPVATIFIAIAQGILKFLFNVRIKDNDPFAKADIEHFYQQSKEQDEENPDRNKELFENALSLPMVKVRQCLVPRTEIEAVDIHTSIAAVKEKLIETRLSKMVVYNGNLDNILGYVHQLDLFKKPIDIQSVLLPIPAVPESMSATDLINKFSRERKSIAWVVDEFGGTAGIVTMEDVLEEIFGDIQDEYDTEELVDKQLSENEYIFSGRMELDYLNEKYDFDFPENEAETLSGYIIEQYKSIPRQKERIIIGRYEFDVLNVGNTRIETIKMKVLR